MTPGMTKRQMAWQFCRAGQERAARAQAGRRRKSVKLHDYHALRDRMAVYFSLSPVKNNAKASWGNE
jgi:hypothetical protein